ncbi:MAG: hypothetical protein KY462_05850 [Actinobacteria bacterium]|nr:hypothetical protein [Actinomycetota bacterium]
MPVEPRSEMLSTGPPAVETGDEPPLRRYVAPGGWRRAITGFVLGAAVGALIGLVLPRDEGPRRTVEPDEWPTPVEI